MVLAKLLSLERGCTRHVTNKKNHEGEKKKTISLQRPFVPETKAEVTEKIIKVTYTACSH